MVDLPGPSDLPHQLLRSSCSKLITRLVSLPRHISSKPSTEAGSVSMVCRAPVDLGFSGRRRVLYRGSILEGEEEA